MKKFLNNIKFLATLLLLTQFEVKAQTYYPAVMNLTVDAGGMGNAVANLPIFCAPGRLNVQPGFSLSYNSSSQSGLCGLGWSLNGLSSISRTGRNYHLDAGVQEGILFNTRDLFLLDGQRLLLTSGNYGQNGSTYQTEQDAFARITYANNQFVIETKNGGKSFYGITQDSKQFPVGNSTHVLNWYLTKSFDANGNFIEYLYETIDDQVLLKEIRYTGFDCTLNGTVTCTEPQEAPFNSIVFTYITKNQSKDRRFINGSLFISNKLLTQVSSFSGQDLFRNYNLSYAQDPVNSVLLKIEEDNGHGEQLEPIELDWRAEGVFDRVLDVNNTNTKDYRVSGDFNGDGKTDLAIFTYSNNEANSTIIKNYSGLKVFTLTEENNRRFYKIIFSLNYPLGKISSISAADIDLDGDDDFILQQTHVWFNEVCNEIKHYQSHEFKYHALISSGTGNLNFSLKTDVFPSRSYNENGYFNFQYVDIHDIFYIQPIIADFDGDGMMDLVERVVRKKNENAGNHWHGITQIPYRKVDPNVRHERMQAYLSTRRHLPNILDRYVGYNSFSNSLAHFIPMDFNGNGKLDLLCTTENNPNTIILEFNNTTNALQVIYNLGFPTQFHKDLKTGDFNGDGNTDLLYYVNNIWMIGYSTGNGGLGFEEHNATLNWFSHNFNVGNGAIRINFSVADLNGDGKSDIVERLVVNGQGNPSSIHAYFSTGDGFVKEFCGANHIENGLPMSFEHIFSGDFNGDGKQDFTLLGTGTSSGPSIPFINEQFNQFKASLKKIHVGSKHNYAFKWGTLPNSKHFKKTALNGPGNPLVLHARNIVPPLTILEELTITSGEREVIQKYFYNNLLYHLHGRGLMGFYNTAIINWNPSLEKRTTIVSEFRQNAEFAHLLNLKTTTTYRKGTLDNAGFVLGQHELSKSIYQYTQIRTTPLNKSIYFVYPNIVTAYDYINDFVKETCFKYDRFGNLTLQKTSDFYLIEYPNITYYQSSVSMAYHKKGLSWIPGSCVKKENVAIKTGLSGHFYTKEIFDYNSKGNLSYNQVFPNNSQYELTTTLQYDTYGNLIHKTISDAQPQIKTEQIMFANQGRFPQTHTNVLGQIKTTTWDSKLGTIESETDYAGTVSTYTYNEWGDILSESRDGLTTLYNKSYTNLYSAFIKKEVIDPFGLVSSAYFDCSGNKIRTESVGFNGIGQVQEYEFNQDNQLMAQSNVYDLGNVSATKRLTEFTYDFLNRVTVVKYHGINQLYKSYNKNKVTETPLKGLTNTAGNVSERTIDPLGNTILVSDVGGEINYQFGHHNKLIATTSNGSTISIEYNTQLNKSKLVDPNAGIMEYKYNAWGELIEQTDAKANKFTYTYDIAGRLTTKTSLSGDEYVYSYYPTPLSAHGEINQLQKESLLKNGILVHEKEFSYFPDGLVKDIKELGANNNTYTSLFEYDSYKRLITAHYPNISLAYAYNNFNDIISITDANSNQLLWQQNEVAVDDRNIKTTYGNGYINQYNYDTYLQLAGITSIKAGSPNVVALDQQYNFQLGSNNLLSRVTAGVGSESFTYDNLNRLTGITETVGSNTKNKVYNYAANGNILSSTNSGAQTLDYTSSKPHAIIDHQFTLNQGVPSTSAEEHSYTYNDFNSITQITQTVLNTPTSHRTIDIAYGVDQQRIKMEYASPTSAYASTTYYIGSSNMEIRGTAEFTYLYDPSGAPFAIHKKTGETGEIYYLHLDHLGSIVAISDEQGGIVEKRSYDAWGRHRHPNTWDYLVMNPFGMGGANDITLRGYTFHEHLPHFSLINMNGRLYDYVMGRMLSPDNYVQSPDNTQSFNRYSYCWNNPLKYTDPSGELIEGLIVATAGFAVGYVSHGLATGDWGKGAIISGGITAAVATIGFYSAGTALTAKSALAFSGKFAANTAINSVMPPADFQMGNVNISMGIGVGFGTAGFGATGSFGIGFNNGKRSFGIGLGGNDNMAAWRASIAFKRKAEGEWHGASFGKTHYGNETGPDGIPNKQVVGQVGIKSGKFSFRLENDFKGAGGDGHDRWRSNAATLGWGNWELGTNLRNNLVEEGSKVDMDGESLIWGKNRSPNGAWRDGQTFSSPLWIGYKRGSTVTRLGYSTPYAQDATQNGIHKYFGPGRTHYFNKYDHFKSGGYTYSGYNNPFTLW